MAEVLKGLIREIPDFPKPGINFYDITTLLKHPGGLRTTVDEFARLFHGRVFDKVVGIESRGFLFGPQLAYQFHAGFVPVRKPGKLPAETAEERYELEYGMDQLEMHRDAVEEGERVLIVDDVIATGGTAVATAKLVESCGGTVSGFGFVVELSFLAGRERLSGYDVQSLVSY
ncbi:MAG: adenine phosphoribosyltransferase [Thermoanaerobaculia bacterium]|nr:adenine phosphoribosyltransferase [Thermoanaerobaculia bacterium]